MIQLSSWFHGIKGKLLFAAVLPIIGFGVANIISSKGISSINNLLNSSHKEIIPNMEALQEMRYERNKFAYHIFASLAELESGISAEHDIQAAKTALAEYELSNKNYADSTFMPEEQVAYDKVKDSFPKVVSLMAKIYALVSSKDPTQLAQAKELMKSDFVSTGAAVSEFSTETLKLYRDRAEKRAL